MKKTIAIFLVIMLCLPLFACGKEQSANNGSIVTSTSTTTITSSTDNATTPTTSSNTQSDDIVITTENWHEYLEVKQIEDWEEDEKGCCISYSLGLKDVYDDKQISELTTLEIEWSGTWVYRKYSCDMTNKTYQIGDIIADKPVEEVAKKSSFHQGILSTNKACVAAQAVMVIGAGTDCVSYVKTIEDFTVTSASGIIRFK